MPWAALAISVIFTASGGVLIWALMTMPARVRMGASANLKRGLDLSVPEDSPLVSRNSRRSVLTRTMVAKRNVTWAQKLIARAGHPAKWPLQRVILLKLVLGLVGLATSALLLASNPTLPYLGVAVAITVGGYFLPEIVLYEIATKRREAMKLEVADTIDQMSIAVEAGLGFDAAMNRVARNGKGVLASELLHTLQEIQAGNPRREAYNALSERANVPDLTRFIRAIIRAEAYGIAVAQVLRTQAADMRVKRRQMAEEKAQQIPVKVVFPLITCIMPTMLMVVLGPAMLQVLNALS